MDISRTVELFYDANTEYEWQRLERHRIEFETTKRYLDKYVSESSRILDVGGGPGRYSIYLASQGHNVTLFDCVLCSESAFSMYIK